MNEEDEAFEDLAKRQGDWGMQGSRKHQIMRYAENVESKGTSMTDKELIKKMYQLLLTEPHSPTLCDQLESIAREALAQPEQEPVAVYGYCPECEAKGVMRERRPDGNDKCAKGHTYPSSKATTAPQRTWVGLTKQQRKEIERQSVYVDGAIRMTEAKLKEKNT